MTNIEQFTELNNFSEEHVIRMHLVVNGGLLNDSLEVHVTLSLRLESWEKILKEIKEDGHILSNNLRSVEITKSSHEYRILTNTWISSFHVTSDDQHRFNSSKTPIIMRLLGKKILAKEIQGGELLGKSLGSDETFSHEHVLTDHTKIGHDDSDRSEEGFQILGKFLTTNISGVHRDESTASGIKSNLCTLKDESGLSSGNSITNLFELSSAHGQYLSLKSVELIEADPSSRGSDSSEDVSHGLIIHLIGAVEDIAGFSEGIGKILG